LGKLFLGFCGVECILCYISYHLEHFPKLKYPTGEEESVGYFLLKWAIYLIAALVVALLPNALKLTGKWLTKCGQKPADVVEAPPIHQEPGPTTRVSEQAPLIQHPTTAKNTNKNKTRKQRRPII
jgi:hypothetical protein